MPATNEDNQVFVLIQRLSDKITCSEVDLQRLCALVRTTEIRDYDDIENSMIGMALWTSLQKSWTLSAGEMERLCWSIWNGWKALIEFNVEDAGNEVDKPFIQTLIGQFDKGLEEFAPNYRELLHALYSCRKDLRGWMRMAIGSLLVKLSSSNPRRAHVASLLQVVEDVIQGFSVVALQPTNNRDQANNVYKAFLEKVLLPLHSPNEMIDWRDQVPILQRYHEALVRCIVRLGEKEAEAEEAADSTNEGVKATTELLAIHSGGLLLTSIQYLLNNWPEGFSANTPKEVLLIHELETLVLEIRKPEHFAAIVTPLLRRIGDCLKHDNARPAQRALTMFKNKKFMEMLRPLAAASFEILLPSLFRDGKLNWNPTVNRMTALALQNLEELDSASFATVANQLFSDFPFEESKGVLGGSNCSNTVFESGNTAIKGDSKRGRDSPQPPSDSPEKMESETGANTGPDSVRAAGRSTDMMPPRIKKPLHQEARGIPADLQSSRWTPSKGGPPPLTLTGVAPWAFKSPSTADAKLPTPPPSSLRTKPSPLAASVRSITDKPAESLHRITDEKSSSQARVSSGDGLRALRDFISRCLPPTKSAQELEQEAAQHWSNIQSLPKPSLLPDLRFHDLVFGKDLGSGTFATVRYARHIQKGKTRSDWPEYAVKVIQISNYGSRDGHSKGGDDPNDRHKDRQTALAAALREIAILQILTHPGIARLISAFRYTGAIYLVLEFGSEGDLHSHVMEHGPMTHSEIKFVAGEILSALLSILETGLSYGDLKPENAVITQAGHIKLVDFGASRPCSPFGAEKLRESVSMSNSSTKDRESGTSRGDAITVLSNMRSGDWRDRAVKDCDSDDNNLVTEAEEKLAWEKLRSEHFDTVEGTPAYLPPEALSSSQMQHRDISNIRVDDWAFGCVLHFLRQGRPRYYGTHEQVYHQQQRDFGESEDSDQGTVRFSLRVQEKPIMDSLEVPSADDDRELDDLVRNILRKDPDFRVKIEDISTHPYLSLQEGGTVNPLSFHLGPLVPLEKRGKGPNRKGRIVGEMGGGGEWAQRQLSKVWSPLPPVYDLSSNSSSATNPYSKTSIEDKSNHLSGAIAEEREEFGSPFISSGVIGHTSWSSPLVPRNHR